MIRFLSKVNANYPQKILRRLFAGVTGNTYQSTDNSASRLIFDPTSSRQVPINQSSQGNTMEPTVTTPQSQQVHLQPNPVSYIAQQTNRPSQSTSEKH